MSFTDFSQNALAVNLGLFAAAAAVVWIAGSRVARYADAIARRTGIGHAAAGLLLLAGITSLPEIAVTVTASAGGNAELAVNNLLGSIALQVAILALADAAIGEDALTSVIPDPVVLLQVAVNILLLSLFAGIAVIGDTALAGIGAGSMLLLAAYVGAIYMIAKSRGRKPWVAPSRGKVKAAASSDVEAPAGARLAAATFAAAGAILAAGWLLSKTGEAIAEQTGLGQSFGGFALVAVSTSLPEASTVIAAVRMRQYVMAVSDIFGTNLFNIGLVFLVDAVYRGGPVMDEIGEFGVFAALLGIVVTAVYLAGLVERRDRTIARMGFDSFVVLGSYVSGLAVLFTLR